MSTEDIICVVRQHRWISADEQAKRFRESGECRIIVSLGGGRRIKEVTRSDLERFARDGTVFRFVYAFLLADPLRYVIAMRSDFEHAVRRLEKRGGAVEDLDSGLSTADEGHRRALMALAVHMIGRDRQGAHSAKNGKKQKGRPLADFTAAQLKEAKAIWRNVKDHPTWFDAGVALAEIVSPNGEKFTTARAHRLWQGRS